MKRTTQDIKRPYCGSDYQLVRAGRRGTYWQAPDGRYVQLAASDYAPVVERSRASVGNVLVWAVWLGAAFARLGRRHADCAVGERRGDEQGMKQSFAAAAAEDGDFECCARHF